ncbi:hypothetical protein HCA61_18675 [Rhodococcus sp. HNM0563]|uniref:hypothetical protein n=1 Tax=Rhodococcus sp. HNM0563 TaxID=2716339 RepID=UPI00146F7D3A|nr:hypothetical protein [Rhodococcus sp. HNM0563]NLU64274.1 hypothetical protein [Rhodococcus sp. HNM0563]
MARIRSIAEGTQNIRAHDSEVDCFYNVIDDDGLHLLHLSTFGSDHRKSKPKSSQSIQLDRDMAVQLIEVLLKTFPDILPAAKAALPSATLGAKNGDGESPIFQSLLRELGITD